MKNRSVSVGLDEFLVKPTFAYKKMKCPTFSFSRRKKYPNESFLVMFTQLDCNFQFRGIGERYETLGRSSRAWKKKIGNQGRLNTKTKQNRIWGMKFSPLFSPVADAPLGAVYIKLIISTRIQNMQIS